MCQCYILPGIAALIVRSDNNSNFFPYCPEPRQIIPIQSTSGFSINFQSTSTQQLWTMRDKERVEPSREASRVLRKWFFGFSTCCEVSSRVSSVSCCFRSSTSACCSSYQERLNRYLARNSPIRSFSFLTSHQFNVASRRCRSTFGFSAACLTFLKESLDRLLFWYAVCVFD